MLDIMPPSLNMPQRQRQVGVIIKAQSPSGASHLLDLNGGPKGAMVHHLIILIHVGGIAVMAGMTGVSVSRRRERRVRLRSQGLRGKLAWRGVVEVSRRYELRRRKDWRGEKKQGSVFLPQRPRGPHSSWLPGEKLVAECGVCGGCS